MAVGRITSGRTPVGARAPEGLSASDQSAILKLIQAEKKAGGDAFVRTRPGRGGIRPEYIAPGPGGGGIVARYIVVPPVIVPMYMVVPPWGGIDAHQAVINKVTADGKMSKREAVIIRRLFNRDIQEAAKDGKDIRSKVGSYLHRVLDSLKADKAARALVFGPGGPGFAKPTGPIAMYIVRAPDQ